MEVEVGSAVANVSDRHASFAVVVDRTQAEVNDLLEVQHGPQTKAPEMRSNLI